ncbi:MAG: preprotein translocase subunit SecE [Eubacterium sp.]|nr:preprotein translocase subunit SecE [Eubacterium sp.]
MAQSNENANKVSWWDGLRAEFNKIIWPDRESVSKQTVAVVVTSVIVGVLIAFIDTIVKYGIDWFIAL